MALQFGTDKERGLVVANLDGWSFLLTILVIDRAWKSSQSHIFPIWWF